MRTDKYIVTETKPDEGDVPYLAMAHAARPDFRQRVLYLDDEVVKGAFYIATSWFFKSSGGAGPEAHSHDFPEVLGFFGSNPADVHDLCGEVEFWLDGEKHLLTRSFMAYVPPGMKHCPLKVLRADRPIFHFSTGPKGMYGGEKK